MGEIITIKLFLVLFCYVDNNNLNTYEVKSLDTPTETGVICTTKKYNIGDTIRFEFVENIVEAKK
jgi:hypothetical protein